MQRISKALLIGAGALTLTLGGFSVASAATGTVKQASPAQVDNEVGEDTDTDTPLTGSDYDRAVAAALAHTGEGEVIETEIGDDGAAYGVELRFDDGLDYEVNLDADFNVMSVELDD